MEEHLEVQNKYVISPCLEKKKRIVAFFKKSPIKCLISSIRGFSCGHRHNLILWAKVNPCCLPGIFLNCSAMRKDVYPWGICIESYLSAKTQLLLIKKVTFVCLSSSPPSQAFLQKCHVSCNSSQALPHPLNTSISVSLSCKWTFSEFPGSLFQVRGPSEQGSRLLVQTIGIYMGGYLLIGFSNDWASRAFRNEADFLLLSDLVAQLSKSTPLSVE